MSTHVIQQQLEILNGNSFLVNRDEEGNESKSSSYDNEHSDSEDEFLRKDERVKLEEQLKKEYLKKQNLRYLSRKTNSAAVSKAKRTVLKKLSRERQEKRVKTIRASRK